MHRLFWLGGMGYTYGVSQGCWTCKEGMLILRWVDLGGSWEQAKTQAECLDYLFEIAVSPDLVDIQFTTD